MKQVNRGFFSVWNTEMAYILGFWFADGWMSQPDTSCHIAFTSADLDHLKAIQSLLASEQKIYVRTGRCYDLTIGSKQLWHDLYRLGGWPAKSLIAEMPFVPQELVHILCVALLMVMAVYTGMLYGGQRLAFTYSVDRGSFSSLRQRLTRKRAWVLRKGGRHFFARKGLRQG
jgi:hypothetical protein